MSGPVIVWRCPGRCCRAEAEQPYDGEPPRLPDGWGRIAIVGQMVALCSSCLRGVCEQVGIEPEPEPVEPVAPPSDDFFADGADETYTPDGEPVEDPSDVLF